MKHITLVIIILLISVNYGFAQSSDEEKENKVTLLDKDDYSSKTKEGIILVDYWASWCGYCRRLEPTLDELAKEGEIKIYKFDVDIEKNKNFAIRRGIKTLPHLILYKDGKKVAEFKGYKSFDTLEKLKKLIKDALEK